MSFIVNFIKSRGFQVVFATCKAALVLGVFTEFAQGMEINHCLYCNNDAPPEYARYHSGSFNESLKFFTFEELDNYIQEEGLPFSYTNASYYELANDVSKQQKISAEIQKHITQRSIPIDRENLIKTVLEHLFARSKNKDKDKILRWESILRQDPQAKDNILQFVKDYNDLNPSSLCVSYGCIKSHSILLNSSGAYHIIDVLEMANDNDWGYCLDVLPKSISSLSWLRSLKFDSEELHEDEKMSIPAEFAKLVNLTKLSLNDCRVEDLSEILSSLTALTKLKIISIVMEKVPDEIGNLTALIELNLTNLGIGELPNTIGKLKNLVHLDISENYIGSLPTSIANLTKLRALIWHADLWQAEDGRSFLPTAFGKFLTKREIKYNFKFSRGELEDWIGDNKLKTRSGNCKSAAISGGSSLDLEDDTIYLKVIKNANMQPLFCCYVVTDSQDKNEYFEGEFTISPLHWDSFSMLKESLMKHLSDEGDVITNGIYCKTLFMDGHNSDEYYRYRHVYGKLKRFNAGYYPMEYRDMVSDCYHRYQDHLLKRWMVTEIAILRSLKYGLDIPSDVTCLIADLSYYIEEEELYLSFQQKEREFDASHGRL